MLVQLYICNPQGGAVEDNAHISARTIFKFWIPLAATWLMMAAEGPFLAAIIARLVDPKYNLAAYGIALSLGLLVEAPIIMMLSAVVALVKDADSYRKMQRFAFTLNGIVTVIMTLLIIPGVFKFIVGDIIGLPPRVVYLAHIATILLLPWPGAIGFRRFYQGLLIRFDKTHRVAYGTILRLTAMSLTALLLYLKFSISGAFVGAAALSAGVVIEAFASRIMVHSILKKLSQNTPIIQPGIKVPGSLTYLEISKFYYPLALSSILGLGAYPLVNFFIGHSQHPIESLAVLPVINSLNFIFASLGLSYQEVGIALLGSQNQNFIRLRNFATWLGITLFSGISIIAFTPLSILWFHNVSGLTLELTDFALWPFRLTILLPALTVLIAFQRALLVKAKMTGAVTWATIVELIGIIGTMYAAVHYFHLIGAIAAGVAYIIGRGSAVVYLAPKTFKIRGKKSAEINKISESWQTY
ncbi:hypothetical protein JW979_07830 [bacterium]|nr:hypothetical protein [candidate division CSSED10-310 bacterium]